MPAVPNAEAYAHANRFAGRAVLITGAASGFGRATAVQFAKHGANLVLGDVDAKGLQETVGMVEREGGKAVAARCDVTKWDDQVALFEAGRKRFGHVDIVLPNAGVSEIGRFDPAEDGPRAAGDKPTPPNLTTLDIDLTAVLYTTRLALWHFERDDRVDPGLRAIAFTGSMSSFFGSDGVMYGAAKAAILGIMKGIIAPALKLNVRVAIVCPYFSKTAILASDFVHPNPKLGYAAVSDVVAAFVTGITDPNPKTNFSTYLIPDQWGVFRMAAAGSFTGAENARRSKAEMAALLAGTAKL